LEAASASISLRVACKSKETVLIDQGCHRPAELPSLDSLGATPTPPFP
jgi:hypothetical protein